MSVRVAVLDDYQDVALKMTDWSVLPSDVQVQVFRDHLADPQDVAQRLRSFEIVMAMRERTPFSRRLLEELPQLKLLITTGMRNASIDVDAARDLGITVCGTRGQGYPTAELTWALILHCAACAAGGQGDTGWAVAGQCGGRTQWEGAGRDWPGEFGLSGGYHRESLWHVAPGLEPEPHGGTRCPVWRHTRQ
jgi:lactate dehydrogenase-like 2-hydroxyacid dehydrogenase